MDWKNEAVLLLDELVLPIPIFVRPMAKKSIKKQIEEVAKEEGVSVVEEDHVIHGYIAAAPKKDIERVKKFLDSKNIDYSKYESLLEVN